MPMPAADAEEAGVVVEALGDVEELPDDGFKTGFITWVITNSESMAGFDAGADTAADAARASAAAAGEGETASKRLRPSTVTGTAAIDLASGISRPVCKLVPP